MNRILCIKLFDLFISVVINFVSVEIASAIGGFWFSFFVLFIFFFLYKYQAESIIITIDILQQWTSLEKSEFNAPRGECAPEINQK